MIIKSALVGLLVQILSIKETVSFGVPSINIHTLLLCRHGDSIWNGGQPGQSERFTGWTDIPLSAQGVREAKEAAMQLSSLCLRDVDFVFTSRLRRAQNTALECLRAIDEKQEEAKPAVHVDYRLNERHYGDLQGLIKKQVEAGEFGHKPELVQQWRRSWSVRPPQMSGGDPRMLSEISQFGVCPNGESLEMVANNRIRPFLREVLVPLLESKGQSSTGLVVAHGNSLRAMIGVLCNVQQDREALQVLEAMKIPTGVPLVLHLAVTKMADNEQPLSYEVLPLSEPVVEKDDGFFHHAQLPVWPLNARMPIDGIRERENTRINHAYR